jgi:hypothetical protein
LIIAHMWRDADGRPRTAPRRQAMPDTVDDPQVDVDALVKRVRDLIADLP